MLGIKKDLALHLLLFYHKYNPNTINTVLTRVGNRFAPKVSLIYARSVFHRRCQFSYENCVQFVSVLHSLLVKYEYIDAVKVELLRERFVAVRVLI